MTYLTVPISAETTDKAFEQARLAVAAGAEALELRTDYLNNLTVESFDRLYADIVSLKTKIIVTARDFDQGGAKQYPQDLRTEIIIRAIAAGADFVDCEYANFVKPQVKELLTAALDKSQTRLILSAHNFQKPFKDIQFLYDSMLLAYPECVPKMAFMPHNINDCFPAFDLLTSCETDAVVLAMGPQGIITRILARAIGSLFCYVSLDDSLATAPGQISISQMKQFYRFDTVSNRTVFYGIIANPVGHSLSPAIHNACFQHCNMDRLYLPILLKGDSLEFNQFMENVRDTESLNFHGFSVTLPHKINALNYAAATGGFVEEQAAMISAVNTLILGCNGCINAYNTDYHGAMEALTNAMGISKAGLYGKTAAVIGAGGVSRAVVAGLTDAGVKTTIYNRTVARARKLAMEFACHYKPLEDMDNLEADIVVNCTNVGMAPDTDFCPIAPELITSSMVVFDTIYNPAETLLLKYARQAGAKTVSGVDMFIFQAAEQFKLFTNQLGPEDVMRNIVESRLM